MSSAIMEELSGWIVDESRPVSYSWLANQISISSDQAKLNLYEWVEQYKKSPPPGNEGQSLLVFYLVSGNVKEGGQTSCAVFLIEEADLDKAKAKFIDGKPTSMHVYSAQLGPKGSAEQDSTIAGSKLSAVYSEEHAQRSELYRGTSAEAERYQTNQSSGVCCTKIARGKGHRAAAGSYSDYADGNKTSSYSKSVNTKSRSTGAARLGFKEKEAKSDAGFKSKSKKQTSASSFFGASSESSSKQGSSGGAKSKPKQTPFSNFFTPKSKGAVKKEKKMVEGVDDEMEMEMEMNDGGSASKKKRSARVIEDSDDSDEDDEGNDILPDPEDDAPEVLEEETSPSPVKKQKTASVAAKRKSTTAGGNIQAMFFSKAKPKPKPQPVADAKPARLTLAQQKEKDSKVGMRLVEKTYEDDKGYLVTEKVWEADPDYVPPAGQPASSSSFSARTEQSEGKENSSNQKEAQPNLAEKKQKNSSFASQGAQVATKQATEKSEEKEKSQPASPPSASKKNTQGQCSMLSFFGKK